MTHARALRPMGLLEIIDQTFRLYRANFWLFFGIAAVVYIPSGLVQQGFSNWMRGLMLTESEVVSPDAVFRFIAVLYGLAAIMLAVYLLVTAALTKAVSDRYMGEPATVGGAYLDLLRRIIPLALTALIGGVLTLIGLGLCFVPGIILFFWIVPFGVQVIMIENKAYFAAMSRSKFLVGEGVWAEWIALFMLTGIIQYIIQIAGSVPLFILQSALGPGSSVTWLVGGFVGGIVQAGALPIVIVACILLYYDSRIRKEGFDLEVLARELGKELPPTPSSGMAPQPWQPSVSAPQESAAGDTGSPAPPTPPTTGEPAPSPPAEQPPQPADREGA
jgi:hypothetical protein